MQKTQITPKNVIQHHLEALRQNDLKELMKDYIEQSELSLQMVQK